MKIADTVLRVMCEKTFPILSRRSDNSRAKAKPGSSKRTSDFGYFLLYHCDINFYEISKMWSYSITIKLSENLYVDGIISQSVRVKERFRNAVNPPTMTPLKLVAASSY